jgi:amidase
MTQSTDFDPATASALETASAVRAGMISAVEACNAAIERIESRDGPINAVVVRDFDAARQAAANIDKTRSSDDERPFLGVPITVKESNDMQGLPTTWGMEELRSYKPKEDAVAVTRLKEAGAVILGKTNLPFSLADWQSNNPIYGRTNNPHDLYRSPGGSSGGSAAALASGMVPFEVGSDIGGSIRVPAHFCGVFGHKPTYGIISSKGHHFPGTDGVDVPLSVVGPMARTADDLEIGLDILAGPTEDIGYTLDLAKPPFTKLSETRILILDDHPLAAADASVRDPLNHLAEELSRLGANVSRDASILPDLEKQHSNYTRMLNTTLTRGVPGAEPIDAHAWMELVDEQMRVTRAWRAIFEEVDVVLTPPVGMSAFPHKDGTVWDNQNHMINGVPESFKAQLAWAGLALFPGLPATIAPITTTTEGLPVGVQIIAKPFGDKISIAFAQGLEQVGLAEAKLAPGCGKSTP